MDVYKVGRYTYHMVLNSRVEYPSYDNTYIQIQFDDNDIAASIKTTNESMFVIKNYYKLSDFWKKDKTAEIERFLNTARVKHTF